MRERQMQRRRQRIKTAAASARKSSNSALEEAIADLEQQMQDSARDYTALNGIIKEKEEKEALLEEKMDRWMYLNDLAEKIEAQAGAHK